MTVSAGIPSAVTAAAAAAAETEYPDALALPPRPTGTAGHRPGVDAAPPRRGAIGAMSGRDPMTEGRTVSVSDYAGQVVAVDLRGGGVDRAAPRQTTRTADHATKDFGVFLGINVRDPQRDKARFRDRQRDCRPPMRTLLALGGSYPSTVIPSTPMLDRRHRVAAVFLRELPSEDLQPAIEPIAVES